MRAWDIEALYSFTLRPNMYLGETTPKNISLFILGYEISSKYECDFANKLKNNIIDKYNISNNKGLEDTLTDLSVLNNNWVSIFQKIAKEILIAESDSTNQEVYLSIQREKFLDFIAVMPNYVDVTWVINFYHIIRSINEWEGKNFNKDILTLIRELEILVGEKLNKMNIDTFEIPQQIKEIITIINEKLKTWENKL